MKSICFAVLAVAMFQMATSQCASSGLYGSSYYGSSPYSSSSYGPSLYGTSCGNALAAPVLPAVAALPSIPSGEVALKITDTLNLLTTSSLLSRTLPNRPTVIPVVQVCQPCCCGCNSNSNSNSNCNCCCSPCSCCNNNSSD